MAKKTSAEKLSDDIDEIFRQYEAGVINGMTEVVKNLANKGRNAIKRNARSVLAKGRKRYSGSWMYQVEGSSNKFAASAVIYQKNQPGLAHLLEHGHAKVGGGRTNPHVHIEPVAEQLANEAIAELKREL